MASNSYGPSTREVSSFFDAPKLVPGQDRKRWRRDVEEWVDFTKQRAESGEKTAKANVRTMGYLLYRALHPDYQAVLDHARDSGQLVLRGGEGQDEAVNTIVSLVGEDTPIDVTNRILSAYQKLHACVRKDEEMPSKFADRFRGLASEYMTLAGIAATGKDSQMLAMVLLQNARLDENTSNAITIQLVAKAESRKSATAASQVGTVKVNVSTMNGFKSAANGLASDITDKLDEAGQDAPVLTSEFATGVADKAKALANDINTLLTPDTLAMTPNSAPEVFLDDVHKALSTLKSSIVKKPSKKESSRIDSIAKQLNDVKSMLGKRKYPEPSDGKKGTEDDPKKTDGRKKSRMDRLKAKTKCKRCGQKGHWYKDPECPMNTEKQGNDQMDTEGDSGNDKVGGQHFPHGGQ